MTLSELLSSYEWNDMMSIDVYSSHPKIMLYKRVDYCDFEFNIFDVVDEEVIIWSIQNNVLSVQIDIDVDRIMQSFEYKCIKIIYDSDPFEFTNNYMDVYTPDIETTMILEAYNMHVSRNAAMNLCDILNVIMELISIEEMDYANELADIIEKHYYIRDDGTYCSNGYIVYPVYDNNNNVIKFMCEIDEQ